MSDKEKDLTKEIDPDKRDWEYSPEGLKIYKPEAGKPIPTPYESDKK
jgi:hypothetical protein